MIYLVGGICIVNIVLWIVFFIRFNKRFSSEKVIEQTRSDMNELVKDLQRNTARNIDLINASIAELQKINAEAEKKIIQLNRKLELINSDIDMRKGSEQIRSAVQSGIANQNYSKKSGAEKSSPTQQYYENIVEGVRVRARTAYPSIDPAQAYQVNKSPQRDLFEEEPIKVNNDVVVTPDGAAYREVPVITTKTLDESKFVNQKTKSINEKVMDLYNMGNSIEDIAAELSISLTEVQFIIDLG